MKVLVCIYNPADLFPPTINAVNALADHFNEVVLVTTRHANEQPPAFPPNVKLIYALQNMQQPRSSVAGLLRFITFTKAVRRQLQHTAFDLAIMYDPHALLSVVMGERFAKKPRIHWYHNHDVYEMATQRRYSAGWFAVKKERSFFPQLDIFSLPSNERQQYFPMDTLKGKYFFIPNFPAVKFMQQFPRAASSEKVIRLIYQGRLSKGHAFEEIIDILSTRVNGKQLQLVLKGFIDPAYKKALQERAEKKGVAQQLEFHGVSAYIEVPKLTASCQVGLSIHQNSDIMTTTLGTSSNKTYEYAALGLPVILLDSPNFKDHLGEFPWAFFTDCSAASLIDCITSIDNNFTSLSARAYHDFTERLNFEHNFSAAVAYSKQLLA